MGGCGNSRAYMLRGECEMPVSSCWVGKDSMVGCGRFMDL